MQSRKRHNQRIQPTRHEPLPDLVLNAYYLLGYDWRETIKAWQAAGLPTPPVMITVANRVETGARVRHAFESRRIQIDELCDPQRALHIDSKVLEEAEAQEEPTALAAGGDAGEERASEEAPAERRLSKGKQAEYLRQMVDTVGKIGQPGEQIQNVISGGMLSEEWDAKTITHIMGLRAFTSQLLCEQGVGRGLRRTSYEIRKQPHPIAGEEVALFAPEYVNIFGVPFTFLPHESTESGPPPPLRPKRRCRWTLPGPRTRFGRRTSCASRTSSSPGST